MATAADSASANTRSPRSSGLPSDSVHQLRWNAKSNLSSPWSHVVRGEPEAILSSSSSSTTTTTTTTSSSSPSSSAAAIIASQEKPSSDSDSVAVSAKASVAASLSSSSSTSPDNSVAVEAQLDSSDNGKSNVPQAKKPAWSKPSNGAAVEVGPVMDAVSWPALSESAKASPKSSSDSLKALSDGSASVPQGPVVASSPQKQAISGNANPTLSSPNHGFSTRQKPMKRVGGPTNGGFTHPQQPSLPPATPPVLETPQNSSGKQGPVIPDSSPGDPHHKNKNWEGGQRGGQPHHGGNDHSQQQRNSSRRGGGGPHSRGDGSYHSSHSGRRDHDRNNYDWNSNRSFGNRDAHMQQPRVNQRNFMRPQLPTAAPFIGAPPVRPFANPMMIPDMASPVYFFPGPHPESIRGVPFVHAAPFMILPPPEPQLRTMIAKQIEYYFSSENLCKDVFLRTNMDEQGWVPVSLIANFNRVKKLTSNIPVILDSVRNSTAVEVQGEKIRKRNDWMNWPPLSPQSPGISNHDLLANRIQTLELEDGKTSNAERSPRGTHGEANASGSSNCSIDSQSQTLNGEGQGKVR